jgi:hypothetical protein
LCAISRKGSKTLSLQRRTRFGAFTALSAHVEVMTGLGGGSPRNVPAVIAPEIKIPQSGQAMYVFALP